MSHIAVFTYPFHGHVNPTLGVVSELVSRGHQVTYATTDEFADAVASTGAAVLRYKGVAGSSLDITVKRPGEITSEEIHESMLGGTAEGLSPLAAAYELLEDDRPDVVLHDLTAFHTGRLLAMRWKLPVIQLCTTLVFTETYNPYSRFMHFYPKIDPAHPFLVKERELLADALAEHGLTGMTPDEFKADTSTVDSSLVFIPKEIQMGAEHFGPEWAFVGPCLGDRAYQGRFTLAKPRADGVPLVVVAFGTFGYAHQQAFFADCVREFTDQPWHVVLVVGKQVNLDELEPLPGNVEAHRWVPQLDLLTQAAVFVSHAGMGSVTESLYTGTPIVLLPQLPEQDLVAEQIEALGVGVTIPREQLSAARVRSAVEALHADPAMPQRLTRVREAMAAAGGSTRAADVIEDCLRRH
ncbi:MAG: hypothetical protein JO100_08380 [Pseudonocardia sp.]|nr:hypothetical protein [Pseudonocardia sp.]